MFSYRKYRIFLYYKPCGNIFLYKCLAIFKKQLYICNRKIIQIAWFILKTMVKRIINLIIGQE